MAAGVPLSDPIRDHVLNLHISRRDPVFLTRRRQRMVGVFNHVQRNVGCDCVEYRLKFSGRAKRIALSLHDQHRHVNARQMRGAQLLRLAGRMERVAERHDATDAELLRVIARREVRRDAAAHRLAADEHARPAEMASGCNNRGAITRVELLGAIRNATTLLRVEEIEREDVDAAVGQSLRKIGDERTLLSCAGAVPEDKRRVHRRAARRIHKASSLSVAADVNRQVHCHTNVVLARAAACELWLRLEEGFMFLVRDIMYCKPGQVRQMVQKFTALSKLGKEMGMGNMRVMTDVCAERYWTVVAETEVKSIEEHAEMARKSMADPRFQEAMKGYHDLIVKGRREIYQLEN